MGGVATNYSCGNTKYEYYGHSGIVVKCVKFNHYSVQSETLYITSSILDGGTCILLQLEVILLLLLHFTS